MGIFDTPEKRRDLGCGIFTTYRATLVFRNRIMGGTPKDPKIVAGWLRTKTGVTDEEELRQMMLRTLVELGADVQADMTFEQLEAASEQLAAVKQTCGFKQDDDLGLYIESRAVKAMIKENINILNAGKKWHPANGTKGKAPRSIVAERVFVNPDRIWLSCREPKVDLFIGHTIGQNGPQSSLTYYEYVERPTIQFEVIVAEDVVAPDDWARMWVLAQENGLGALRSQGFGRFDIEQWESARA